MAPYSLAMNSPHDRRDYSDLPTAVCNTLHERMIALVDLLWERFHSQGYSWVGFYMPGQAESGAAAGEMILGPCRNSPACSPIGLHGMCGLAYLHRRSVLVHDTQTLSDHYIACDPRDRSEVVIPMLDQKGMCVGVLDIDSHQPGAFTTHDIACLCDLLEAWHLTEPLGTQGRWPILAGCAPDTTAPQG